VKAKWGDPNFEIIAKLPPLKRMIYLFRRDAFFRYELPFLSLLCAALYLINLYLRS
jgi:hypothetical protein